MNEQNSSSPGVESTGGSAAPVFVLFGVLVFVLIAMFMGNASLRATSPSPAAATATASTLVEAAQVAQVPTIGSQPPPLEVAAVPQDAAHAEYTDQQIAAGGQIYSSLCFACHGSDAQGISGLGKTLIGTDFINGQTDEQLVAFLIVGRSATDPLNTSGQVMPARGGNPMLSDADLLNVVAYIRELNAAAAPADTTTQEQASAEPAIVATIRPFAPPPINALDAAVVPAFGGPAGEVVLPPFETAGTSDLPVAEPGSAAADYAWSCGACHADRTLLAQSPMSDADIRAMLTTAGPPVWEIDGFTHAYRGGYPPLTDAQIDALIAYLRGG
ncbi:MAG: c-type cytochrome [Pleurocapsa minor GSE-CHR-MK-17-07R]|jgi:mono/diheme cytochrome c family protein|nr:c-type cytochrome [Pleurocapsa minor GSE-CHR-MK 17-07R]